MRAGEVMKQLKGKAFVSLLACLAASSGCSLVLDTEKKQCTKAADCGKQDGKAIYACEQNYCVDKVFGCFNEPPPDKSGEEPVLKFELIQFINKRPVKNLNIKVCTTLDTACNNPLPVEWDAEAYAQTGVVTMHGLEYSRQMALRFTGTDDEGFPLLETEYFMERPVTGLTEEASQFEMIPDYLAGSVAGTSGERYDPTKGLVLAQLFGCDNEELAGVTATDNRPSTLFYLTGGTADPNAKATDGSGQVGFLNMETGADGTPFLHKLTFLYDGNPMFSFAVTPRPGVLTFLYLYMPDFGTTTDRAETAPR
jgi:hypothetical protein